jgi:hypothetical protein
MESSEPARKPASNILRALTSSSFLERSFLLMLAAIISGLMIPELSNRIQSQNMKREIVLAKQAALLDDLSHTLLAYETLILDVSWYKSNSQVYNEAMHQRAFDRYAERFPDLLVELRTGLLRARYLASADMVKRLEEFQERIFSEQDTPLSALYVNKESTIQDWSEFHNKNVAMALTVNDLLTDLAKDLNITKENI